GSITDRPKYGTPHSAAIPSIAAVPMADSIMLARVVLDIALDVHMKRQPCDLEGAGQARRRFVRQVVAGLQAGGPGRGQQEGGARLGQDVIADVVVPAAPM